MKIVIAASHRFHLLDLAIQLEKLGHDVTFYSYVSAKRTVKFGLSKKASKSLLVHSIPALIISRIFGFNNQTKRLANYILDFWVSVLMPPCDVFIGLGTVYSEAFNVAKERHGAKTICEWGSTHIDAQERALADGPTANPTPSDLVKRTKKAFDAADYIAIPSSHVHESFIFAGVPKEKLFRNPYGVNLGQFFPTQLVNNKIDQFDVIMVGGWCYRKGCDLLVEACKKERLKLLHVGPIIDLPFPEDEFCIHQEPVDQVQLVNFYSTARVFALTSREEGLAMVQAQAIACGLPLVCSAHSGGRDLAQVLPDPTWIIETPLTVDAISAALQKALKLSRSQVGVRDFMSKELQSLSWKAYGSRYNSFLASI